MKNEIKTQNQSIEQFVASVRKRLSTNLLWHSLLWATAAGALAMLIVALIYVWPGYQVPPVMYLFVFGISTASGITGWACCRPSSHKAAQFADQFFHLKDSVRSNLSFAEQGNEGGFYDLQSRQTERLVEDSAASDIKFQFAFRLLILTGLLVAISIALGLKPASPEIVALEKEKKATLTYTEAANEELKQLVDELEKELTDEKEKKLLEPNKLRKWVKELDKLEDRKEAMRQYAKLEMKLNRAAEALQQRKDEKLLDNIAEELKSAEDSRELAKKLKQKKYKAAAKDLQARKPSDLDPTKQRLSEERKRLAKLKALANKMADTARNSKRTASPNASSKKSTSKNSNSPSSESASANSKQDELSDMLEELEESLEEYEATLEKLELAEQDQNQQEDLDECESCRQCAGDKLDKLGDKLLKLARKRSARSKLKKLSQKCSQCQSMSQALVQSESKGGKKAGKGSVDSKKDSADKRIDNEQYSQLKGIKGKGPSLTKIESAEDGTGVSTRQHVEKKREFKRQFESFVGREDVPDSLKSGVKNYFTNIHESGEDSSPDDE